MDGNHGQGEAVEPPVHEGARARNRDHDHDPHRLNATHVVGAMLRQHMNANTGQGEAVVTPVVDEGARDLHRLNAIHLPVTVLCQDRGAVR